MRLGKLDFFIIFLKDFFILRLVIRLCNTIGLDVLSFFLNVLCNYYYKVIILKNYLMFLINKMLTTSDYTV